MEKIKPVFIPDQNQELEVLEDVIHDEQVVQARTRNLIIYNDDYHTFDFVIEALMEICNHDSVQAEQCTYLIHHKGKCAVKSGTYIKLNPMRIALCDIGLSAVIE